ncbi:DUF4340 domain-containing protein [Candidatus Roizmanbacteria bacterium]|nr:DUF4340 domain-containing protein [Candidatus Roizmanbacteria bacterium]
MKKNSARLAVLLVTLLVLGTVVLAVLFWQKYKNSKSGYFATVKKENISEVDISQAQKSQRVKKTPQGWYVDADSTRFKADDERITGLLEAFFLLKTDTVVSTNKNKHAELGIDKNIILFKENGHQYLIYIGATAGPDSSYVRIGENNEVFIAKGFSDAYSPLDYRDLRLPIVADETKVQAVRLSYGIVSLLLRKNKDRWAVDDKDAIREHIDFFLNDIKTLRAKDITRQNNSAVQLPQPPDLEIDVDESGKNTSAFFYKSDETKYAATIANLPFVYQLQSAYIESLKKVQKDFTN